MMRIFKPNFHILQVWPRSPLDQNAQQLTYADTQRSRKRKGHGNAKVTRRSRVAKTQPVAKPQGLHEDAKGPEAVAAFGPLCSEEKNYFTSSQRSSACC